MNKVIVLDCTLRDGGYINQWEFGQENIKKINKKLIEANIDIIECGYLNSSAEFKHDYTIFDNVERVKKYLPNYRKNSLIVCMINYGEYEIDYLNENDGTSIDGIRVAFHKNDLVDALNFCKKVNQKGYKLFIQPMVSISYTDAEFLFLINEVNKIQPYAFYIVDSFGVMKKNNLLRLYYLVDHNLDKNIYVGYHSHNNIQMSYANAQTLVDFSLKHNLIVDSSVFGMGRGAGNLNTELFIDYLNEFNNQIYNVNPLLQIIDQILGPLYLNNYWGYSLPHYISAVHNCHPNYASFLDSKNTLTIENINEILGSMDKDKKNVYDKGYIDNLYKKYQSNIISDEISREELKEIFRGKTVVLIAPGSSIMIEESKIKEALAQHNTLGVSVNFIPDMFDCDYIFVSNLRRYEEVKGNRDVRLIITSNIRNDDITGYVVNYSNLINSIDFVEDNAGMMLIKLLITLDVKDIKLAGLDGYSYDVYDNYAEKDMAFIKSHSAMDAINSGIEIMLKDFSKKMHIEFITMPKHITTLNEQI